MTDTDKQRAERLRQAALDELAWHGGNQAEIARMREHLRKAAAEKESQSTDIKIPE